MTGTDQCQWCRYDGPRLPGSVLYTVAHVNRKGKPCRDRPASTRETTAVEREQNLEQLLDEVETW